MPILKGKCFPLAKPVDTVGAKDTIYVIPHTNEQFVSKEEYTKRLALYNEAVWTCQCTGATKLTHQEALDSEQEALKQLNSTYPVVFERAVLELVHLSVNPLDVLVDRSSKRLHETLVIGERVTLKVTSQGTSLRGVIVKMDSSCADKVNTSTPNAEAVTESSETDDVRKKFKLLPYKYSVKLEGQDSIINGIPANDLVRETHVPNKDLIKLFIRARAVRSSNVFCSAWVVDENYVRKHSLQKKGFTSPHRVANSSVSSGKSPKQQKDKNLLINGKRSQSEEKPKSKPSRENKSTEKVKNKKRSLGSLKTGCKDGTPGKKAKKRLLVDTEGSTSSDLPLAKLANKSKEIDEDDDDIVLAVLKKAVKKKKRQEKVSSNDMPLSELQNRKTPSSDCSDDDDDIALAALKPKKSLVGEKKERTSNKTSKSSPSKMKFKQVTLYQLNCVKKVPGTSPTKGSPHTTPSKQSGKSPKKPPKSPYQLPPLVARLQKADKEQSKGLFHQLVNRCVRDLTESQIKSLPEDMKNLLIPKFERYQEKKKLESMSEAEREAYLLKKKEERKQQVKEQMKKRMADAKKRFEDTKLDLKPIPVPKLVPTPDGLANELFGDAAMVTEFIASYKGLLMPDDNTHVTADLLMQALVNGQQGFPFLSKVLVILLQTLLQDHLADDYKELSCPLSELPVNEYTASELVRLCLRHQDAEDDNSSSKDEDNENENAAFEEEVPADIIDLLETSEFHDLEPNEKLQILVGFCHRIMASYSVQDYMNEKQQDAAELWKKRIAEQKVVNDKKKEDKKTKKDKQQNDTDAVDARQSAASSVPQGLNKSGSTASLDEMGDDEEDLVTKLKRRRLLAAKAAEEKRKKEVEEKQLREELRQQRELELAEKSFHDGISLAKHVLRRTALGLDRNHDRYWLFPSALPGLFIEKGWVSDDVNYCIGSKLSMSVSASESEAENAETEGCDGDDSCARLNTTLPHTGQNLWFILDTVDDFQKLLDSLHPQGVRESSLKAALTKNYDTIVKSLSKSSRSSEVTAKVEEDVIIEGTRKELQDMEIRLRHGGLGGVPNFERWEKRLNAARTVKDFTELLIETQTHVVERFVTGMMAKSGKKPLNSENDGDDSESVDDKDKDAKSIDEKSSPVSGVQQWLDAVAQCTTFSRFNVLMGMLECCIKWEKSAENAKCKICRKKGEEDHLLLCDECNQAFHLYCLRPALSSVPKGEWYCPACSPERSTRKCRADERKGKWSMEAGSSDEDEEMSDEIEHEETCAVCGEEGDLAECSSCVSAFHLDCHDPPMRHIPRQNTWKCMQCKSGVRLRKSRRPATKTRKRYTYSDDETDNEEEIPVKKSKRSSPATQNNKRASDAERPVSRSRTRGSDAGVVTPTVQSTEGNSRSRRSDTSTKENRLFDENTKQAVLSIIDKLRKHRQSWPFLEPVDPQEVPDYHKVVKKPVDLRTMEDKCISDVYLKPQHFMEDFSVMMKNAEQYNEVDSPVYKCVNQFEKYFELLVDRNLPGCTYRR